MPRPMYPPSHDKEENNSASMVFGSVTLDILSPFDLKPRRRPKPDVCRTIFVGSLPETCVESHLVDLFSNCGTIVEVRVSRGRNFGHIQFTLDSSVERAMELSGSTIHIEHSHARKDSSKIHVDYAQDKQEVELKRRIDECELMNYSSGSVAMISSDLHREEAFTYAATNVIHWLGRTSVDDDESTTSLYGLISAVNQRGRKVNKNMQTVDEEQLEFKVKKKISLKNLLTDCTFLLLIISFMFISPPPPPPISPPYLKFLPMNICAYPLQVKGCWKYLMLVPVLRFGISLVKGRESLFFSGRNKLR